MTRAVERTMARKLREYRRQGKSAEWIRAWKRGWYSVRDSGAWLDGHCTGESRS